MATLLHPPTEAAGPVHLPVPFHAKEAQNLCWAACAQMLLESGGTTVPQCELARVLGGDCCADLRACDEGLCDARITALLIERHVRSVCYRSGTLTQPALLAELDGGRPVQLGFTYGDDSGHVVLVAGYDVAPEPEFAVFDPDFVVPTTMTFAQLQTANGDGKWDATWIVDPGMPAAALPAGAPAATAAGPRLAAVEALLATPAGHPDESPVAAASAASALPLWLIPSSLPTDATTLDGVAQDTKLFQHHLTLSGEAAYARSVREDGTMRVVSVAVTPAAALVTRGLDVLRAKVAGPGEVRLLTAPAHRVLALWLVAPEGRRVLVVSVGNAAPPEAVADKPLDEGSFLDFLRPLPTVAGRIPRS